MVGDDAHAPVGLLIQISELRNHGVRFGFVEEAEPHRHGSEHAGLVHGVIAFVQRESKAFFVGEPEGIVHQRLLLHESFLELFACLFFAGKAGEIRERAQRSDAEAGLI